MTTPNELKQKTELILEDLDPIQHLKELDYPRRAGTDGERKAAAYIAGVLEANGIAPDFQEFHFFKPKVLPRLILPLVLLVWALVSVANIEYWDNNLIVSLFVLALPLAFLMTILFFDRLMRYSFGRRRKKLQKVETEFKDGTLHADQVITSQNIIAEIGPEDAEKEILFTAHYDSISSKLPMRITMVGSMLGFGGFLAYSTFYLINTITGSFFTLYAPYYAVLAGVVLVLLEVFFLARLFRSNDSHGVIDDGTGVAILLELAKFIKSNPIPSTKFTFGFFSAEESGLVGSAYYYTHRAVDKSKLHVITVDMIGEKPPLAYVKGIYPVRRRRMDGPFNERLVSIAEMLEIEIKGSNFPYPGSDFGHFLVDGECTTNWLINRSRMIHSKRDHLGNVNKALVNDALKLMVAYLLGEKSR